MPKFKARLAPTQIQALAEYVLKLKNPGTK